MIDTLEDIRERDKKRHRRKVWLRWIRMSWGFFKHNWYKTKMWKWRPRLEQCGGGCATYPEKIREIEQRSFQRIADAINQEREIGKAMGLLPDDEEDTKQ